jgi:peptidoglycan/LPS O-acetylase OafA/YrhL
MKKGFLVLLIGGLVLATSIMWLVSSKNIMSTFDLLNFGIILLVIAFAVFVGYKRLTSAKRGEPTEDEMSKKVLLKTSSLSYYISLYLWVALIFVKDHVKLDSEELLGAGILGMALIFAICWLVFNFMGVKNE